MFTYYPPSPREVASHIGRLGTPVLTIFEFFLHPIIGIKLLQKQRIKYQNSLFIFSRFYTIGGATPGPAGARAPAGNAVPRLEKYWYFNIMSRLPVVPHLRSSCPGCAPACPKSWRRHCFTRIVAHQPFAPHTSPITNSFPTQLI